MKIVDIDQEKGRHWMERWLSEGHFVSEAVLANASFDYGHFKTCITDEAAAKLLPDFETGWIVSRNEVEEWLSEILDELKLRGARCLIVEDDLSNPTDPHVLSDGIPTAFINDRVLPGAISAPVAEIMLSKG